MTEKPIDFEDWYTVVFGGHLTEEQASDELRIAYDYYVDNWKLTIENAELKEKLEIEQKVRGDWFGKAVNKDGRLNEAKEHIRTLISCLIDWVQEGDKNYCHIVDAEQFLKE